MVEKKYLKWTLIIPFFFIVLAVLSVLLYILTPVILSVMLGGDIIYSCPDIGSGHDPQQLVASLYGLCSSLQVFLGVLIMVLIVLSGFCGFISMCVTTVDAATSKTISRGEKAVWILAMWLFAGLLVSIAYYFVHVRKREN
jgi:hypothetical protein